MKDSVLISIGLFFWFLAIHPFTTYPLSLWLMFLGRGCRSRLPGGLSDSLTVSVCTCAYNEEPVIERKIANLFDLRERHPGLDISIYVDGASDRTGEIVASYGNLLVADVSNERHGKTYGMNRLVRRSRADIIIFTDANVEMDIDAVDNVLRYFQDPSVGCVCGNLTYTNSTDSITASTGSLYWRLEQFIKRRESDFGAVMGADGSLFAIRRELHRAPPDHIIDDMYVSLRILIDGSQVIQVDDFRAFEQSVTSGTEEFCRKVRIACQAFNVHRLMWPLLRQRLGVLRLYMYISHKFLRWLSIYFLILGACAILLTFFLMGRPAIGEAITIIVASLILAGALFQIPVLSSLVDVLTALLGAGIGVWRSIRGERYQTWQPAASIRR